jgi:hypothetical protein
MIPGARGTLKSILELLVVDHVGHFEPHIQFEAIAELGYEPHAVTFCVQKTFSVYLSGEDKLCA